MFVFFHIWDHTPRRAPRPDPKPREGCYLASKANPTVPGPFTEVCLFSPRNLADGRMSADNFGGVAPVKVRNADHSWLPPDAAKQADEGLVLFGIGGNDVFLSGYTGVHLAWMPLIGDTPNLADVRYFTDLPNQWDASAERAVPLFGKAPNLQSISAAFLKGPQKWIVLHMTADETKRMTGPVIARIGTPPFDWSETFSLFDPCRESAYGRYMHWPDLDSIQLDDPFRTAPQSREERKRLEAERAERKPSSAYGAFLLERFTRWDGASQQLDLYYLLSFGSPYQVQVMHTTLRLLT